MRKGIEAAITIVILLLVAVAIVGLAYAFISGLLGTVTSKVALISGSSTCTSEDFAFLTTIYGVGVWGVYVGNLPYEGVAKIAIKNVGSSPIDVRDSLTAGGGDLTIVRTNPPPSSTYGPTQWAPQLPSGPCNIVGNQCILNPDESAILIETPLIPHPTGGTPPFVLVQIHCGPGNSCTYGVTVGGITYTTRANC